MKDLKQKYVCSSSIVEPDKLCLKSTNVATGIVVEETVVFEDHVLLVATKDLLGAPLEEYEYGLYHNYVTLTNVVEMTRSLAKEQLYFNKE